MSQFEVRGNEIKKLAKELVYDFMKSNPNCQSNSSGMRQSEIFRACGFDWGDFPKVTSSNQQYWVCAILKQLESEKKITRVSDSGPWRLV